MSKIGSTPIKIPQGVEVTIEKSKIFAKGSNGEASVKIPKNILVEQKGETLTVKRSSDSKEGKAFHGLARSLINNAIVGVSEGFSKTLELSGIGFRANTQDDKLVLNVG